MYNRFLRRVACAAVVVCLFAVAPVHAHKGLPNLGANKACAEQTLGDRCEWTDSHGARYVGSCRQISDSLLCVRNQPIIPPPADAADHGSDGHTHDDGDHEHHGSVVWWVMLGLVAFVGVGWIAWRGSKANK